MTIATYSDLTSAIANWSNRADLSPRTDEIIDSAEAQINRDLRTLEMESKNSSFPITGEFVAVPANFGEVRSFMLNTTPRRALTFVPDDMQDFLYGTGSGIPRYFNVVGSNFRFAPIPDGSYTATLVYYLRVPALSATITTNWLITSHPDIYLAACQVWTAMYTEDDAGLARWGGIYQELMRSLKKADSRTRWGGNGMAVRPA